MPPRRSVGKIEPYRTPGPEPSPPDEDPAGPEPAPAPPPEPDYPGSSRVAVRFDRAAAAAGYLGQLLDGGPRNPVVRHGDGAWWVEGDLSLLLARELARLSAGRVHLVSGDRLLLDQGWGQAPEPGRAESRPAAGLAEVPPLDLVRAAGLRTRSAGRPRQLHLLVPAERAAVWISRGLDLGLSVSYRPVQVTPLFTEPEPGGPAEGGTFTEVRLQVVRRDADRRAELPASLVIALDRNLDVLACRSTGRLLIQHGRHSPLPDRQLEFLVQTSANEGGSPAAAGQTWVLADPPHGCWNLVPLAGFTDGWQLVQLGPAHRLEPGDLARADESDVGELPEPSRLTVVRTSRTGDPLDALLLNDAELGFLQALLENHPLAELAQLVPGRDRHLLVAPGGIIDRIPVGRGLARVAPVPVYVAHGWRTEPRLPAGAWRELAAAMRDRAVVLEPDRALAFDLALARPVWELWAGELPPFDDQLPEGAETVLLDLDAAGAVRAGGPRPPVPGQRPGVTPVAQPGRRRRWVERITRTSAFGRRSVTWQQQAMEAVRGGDPERAARLHEQHGDYIRAARLFEDAAVLKESSES